MRLGTQAYREDVSEKLGYTPDVFTVERHVRGKCVGDNCETLIQAPVPAQVIGKDISTAGVLAMSGSRSSLTIFRRHLNDETAPIDNIWAKNQIRPWALGRKNWLFFAGSNRSGKRAAAIMSLIQSARLNGHDPYA